MSAVSYLTLLSKILMSHKRCLGKCIEPARVLTFGHFSADARAWRCSQEYCRSKHDL